MSAVRMIGEPGVVELNVQYRFECMIRMLLSPLPIRPRKLFQVKAEQVGTEVERANDLIRSALRCVVAISKVDEVEVSTSRCFIVMHMTILSQVDTLLYEFTDAVFLSSLFVLFVMSRARTLLRACDVVFWV